MLNEDDIQVDSYLLEDGRRVYRMTHIATGVFVEDEPDKEEAIILRMRKLKDKLEATVAGNTQRK